MKKIFFSIFLFISMSCFGQIEKSFKFENEGIIWEAIFNTDLTFSEICEAIENEGMECNVKNNYILGNTKGYVMNTYGKGRMSTPFIISLNTYSFDYRIDYKEGKYRVIIKNFMLTAKEDNPMFGKIGTITTLEEMTKKRNKLEFRDNAKDALHIIDTNLENTFSFKKQNDNW